MLKRLCLLFFFVVVVQIYQPSAAHSQTPASCKIVTIWYFPDPLPVGFSYYGPGQGNFSYLISAQSSACAPHSKPCLKCLTATQPISLSTGNTFIEQRDISIPGLGGGLSLTRTWNSALQPDLQLVWSHGPDHGPSILPVPPSIFGGNWRSTYEEQIYLGQDEYLKYLRSDGSVWTFGLDPSGTGGFRLASPANISAKLNTGNPTTLTFPNGEQRRFDISGKLIAIVDRNGNTTSVAYDAYGRLSVVTDPASRHLTFNYPNSNSVLVSSVSSDVGVSVSYTYNLTSLQQVTEQDSSTLNFGYNALGLITQVTDSQGKIIESHTYDLFGRGLTGSKANGVESVSVTYP